MACKDQRFIDLHIHSTVSDGTVEPLEIINASLKAGLSAISITDHDTTDGCKQVLAQPSPPPIDFITGVEISASLPETITPAGSIHILGYDLDVHEVRLNEGLAKLRAARNARSPKMIQRLREIGFDLSVEDVIPYALGGQMGRPHIARAMLEKGYVSSIDQAFDRYLGKKGSAYVDKHRIPSKKAIELITGAGGVPVLAHPGLIATAGEDGLRSLIGLLAEYGLQGIEAYYPGHSERQTSFYLQLAREFGLVITGGSDFHGELNPAIKLGRGAGDLCVGYPVYEQLVAFSRGKTPSPDRN